MAVNKRIPLLGLGAALIEFVDPARVREREDIVNPDGPWARSSRSR